MRTWIAVAAALLLAWGAPGAAEAKWPNDKVITFVVGYPAGTGVDLVARVLADSLARKWGANIIVENRSGASGTIAQNYVARSRPDGYTFMVETPSSAANAVLIYPSLPYDPVKDFSFVGRLNSDSMVLYVGPRVTATDLREFEAYAKANPGKLQFGNPGVGTYAQMTQLTLQDLFGTTFNLVQYRGAPQMITDLLDKQIDAVIDLIGGYQPQLQAGNLRAIAVFGDHGDPRLPGVKTAQEQGVPFSVNAWYGMEGPKGLPREIITEMNAAVTDALLHDDSVRSKMTSIGVTPDPSTPEELERIVGAEIEKWRPVVDKYHIRAE